VSAYLPEVFLPGAWKCLGPARNNLGTATGPTGREIGAQGFGHRPMPWATGDRSTPRPEGPREVLFETAPLPGEGSRGPSGRMIVVAIGSQGIGLRPHPWALFSRPRWAGKDGRQQHRFKLREKAEAKTAPAFAAPASASIGATLFSSCQAAASAPIP
jgi:hypothetical protein